MRLISIFLIIVMSSGVVVAKSKLKSEQIVRAKIKFEFDQFNKSRSKKALLEMAKRTGTFGKADLAYLSSNVNKYKGPLPSIDLKGNKIVIGDTVTLEIVDLLKNKIRLNGYLIKSKKRSLKEKSKYFSRIMSSQKTAFSFFIRPAYANQVFSQILNDMTALTDEVLSSTPQQLVNHALTDSDSWLASRKDSIMPSMRCTTEGDLQVLFTEKTKDQNDSSEFLVTEFNVDLPAVDTSDLLEGGRFFSSMNVEGLSELLEEYFDAERLRAGARDSVRKQEIQQQNKQMQIRRVTMYPKSAAFRGSLVQADNSSLAKRARAKQGGLYQAAKKSDTDFVNSLSYLVRAASICCLSEDKSSCMDTLENEIQTITDPNKNRLGWPSQSPSGTI